MLPAWLPKYATVTETNGTPTNLSGTGSDTPDATVQVNDAPTIVVTANDFTENDAAAGQTAATYETADEDGNDLTVTFTAGSGSVVDLDLVAASLGDLSCSETPCAEEIFRDGFESGDTAAWAGP